MKFTQPPTNCQLLFLSPWINKLYYSQFPPMTSVTRDFWNTSVRPQRFSTFARYALKTSYLLPLELAFRSLLFSGWVSLSLPHARLLFIFQWYPRGNPFSRVQCRYSGEPNPSENHFRWPHFLCFIFYVYFHTRKVFLFIILELMWRL